MDWFENIKPGPSRTYQDSIPDSLDEGIKLRKIKPQNVLYRLRDRETRNPPPGTDLHVARRFHTCVFPNFTVVNVEKPPCFLRKFSPDGRYFIAFSADQTSLEIYEFQGPAVVEHLLKDVTNTDCLIGGTDFQSHTIRANMFSQFLKLKHTTNVSSNSEHLNRECSLFTDDGKYVIVGSAVHLPEEPYPPFFEIYRNNESVTPNKRHPLEDYTLHIVEIETGHLTDSVHFKCDKIILSHNQGLYLLKDTLAVLSIQQQTIHIFQVTSDGRFIEVRSIGRFCYEDDQLFLSQAQTPTVANHQSSGNQQVPRPEKPFNDQTINCLKHRLLAFLFRKAHADSQYVGNVAPLLRFYHFFDQLRQLRMWKMQLLDEHHILIKYASAEVVTLRISDPNLQPSFFVIYNMSDTKIQAVYENTSEELLELFENFCDVFRNARLSCEAQFTCSASSNIHSRQIQQQFKQTITNAKFGGQTEAVKRLLAQLPISAQSYSGSPYLDLALFSYDDKWVSVMERPKTCGDHPIRFYDRQSGLLKFKINAGVGARSSSGHSSGRRLVAFTFHPWEPFAISVQRTNAEYIVNFHIRHAVCEGL